jgi:hypothetical protein
MQISIVRFYINDEVRNILFFMSNRVDMKQSFKAEKRKDSIQVNILKGVEKENEFDLLTKSDNRGLICGTC